MTEPRILHFHDAADVGGALVRAASRQGLDWDYLGAEAVRPSQRPQNALASKLVTASLMATFHRRIRRADVLHIHYAMVVPAATQRLMPRRPYVLHLHGTDIRHHWAGLRRRSTVQTYIDGAEHVYYTNLDTRENAEEARPDAEFMPAFIEPDRLTTWTPADSGPPRVLFLSRWEDNKGASHNLELARALHRARPDIALEGLAWGAHAAEAAAAGVHLVPRMPHEEYARWLASAHIGIGQANEMLGVSEFEAMAIGVPLAVLGQRIPRPDDGTTPPVLEGTVADVVEQISQQIADPVAASRALGGDEWALSHHLADPYVQPLMALYRRIVGAA